MGTIKLELPQQLTEAINRQVADGRVASDVAFLIEAAVRFAEELEAENEIIAEARAGIDDARSGRFVTIDTPDDQEELYMRTMARVRAEISAPED